MDVILKVLEGAKTGAKIAVKKEAFLIGRSPECHLCSGSSAISRRHCVIRRRDGQVTVEDLGSRNGTLVNGVKSSGETPLKSGDELIIGPLKFMVTISLGVNNDKAAPVKSLAEAAERTAASSSSVIHEDDISRWLLGKESESASFSETKTIRMDDTGALQMHLAAEAAAAAAAAADAESAPEESEADAKESAKGSGKFPVRSEPQTKDSREAAAQALRNWSRRR
jgi:pSer/pThr/pTyr-binding forkhead associated (FHA) protein